MQEQESADGCSTPGEDDEASLQSHHQKERRRLRFLRRESIIFRERFVVKSPQGKKQEVSIPDFDIRSTTND